MSLPDHMLEPEDEEPMCTGDTWSCHCAECRQWWEDTRADEQVEEMLDRLYARRPPW